MVQTWYVREHDETLVSVVKNLFKVLQGGVYKKFIRSLFRVVLN